MPQAQKHGNGQEKANTNFGVLAWSILLPKGGVAIQDFWKKFTTNPVTGTGSMTTPIATSPGKSGFGSKLSLPFGTRPGNGALGLGGCLSIPPVSRKADEDLPRYRVAKEFDFFILPGAENLIPIILSSNDAKWESELVLASPIKCIRFRRCRLALDFQRQRPDHLRQ